MSVDSQCSRTCCSLSASPIRRSRIETPARQRDRRVTEARFVLGTLAAVVLFGALGYEALAAPDAVSSNARLSLNDMAFVEETSEFVTVLGSLHVQTKALADGSVDLQANVADGVLVYSADVQSPTTERRQQLLALRQQAVELVNQIEALQLELGELREALDGEINPFVRKRLEDLIQRAERRLSELSRELEKVLAAMRALLEDIGDEEGRDPLYSLAGVQRSLITCAPAIPCSAYLLYPLDHASQGGAGLTCKPEPAVLVEGSAVVRRCGRRARVSSRLAAWFLTSAGTPERTRPLSRGASSVHRRTPPDRTCRSLAGSGRCRARDSSCP